MLIVVLAMLLEIMLNLVKMVASTALATRSGWSIWPGMPGQFAPEWGGQFDAESMVTFRRNQVVNISGISSIARHQRQDIEAIPSKKRGGNTT
jgi:hypothetical protein